MPSKPSPGKTTHHTVPVLRKAVRVFEAVAQSSGDATTKSLAASLRISPSTCYRILQSFVAAGWLRPRTGGAFELSFGLVPLLRPLLRHELLIETVREPLTRLASMTGLTAKLTVRQGDDAVTLFSAPSPRPHAIASRVGAVVSLAIGSSGAAFLGALPDTEVGRILDSAPAEAWKFQKREVVLRRVREVRKLGCSFDGGSYQPHIHTLSAPLYAQGKEVVGVITLLGFPQDFAGTAKAEFIRELKYTAGGCNQLIQGPATASAA
jgi:DNA-binding IclR family transcriptional regulator